MTVFYGVEMNESKEQNKYTSLIIVLSVLLAISLVAGATFAWFASSQEKLRTISLGDPVVVNISQNSTGQIKPVGAEIPFVINGERLLPGMRINTYAAVKFQESRTPALLRVKLIATVEGGTASTEEIASLAAVLNQQIYDRANGYVEEGYKWMLDSTSGWWYYTGGTNNDFVTPRNSICESINCEAGPILDFLDPYNKGQFVYLPGSVDNKFATAKVTFWFAVQAVQALIPSDSADPNGGFMVPTIENAERVFKEAFSGSDSNI